jgi:FkbM family methyltransferase
MKAIKKLDPLAPQSIQYCTSPTLRDLNIRTNNQKVKGRITPEDPKPDPIAIVGYGPSLNDTWEKIKDFKYVISCSGATKFLISKGIIPNYHLDVDPRPHKKELIGTPHPDVEYLMASAVHPEVIDHLLAHNAKVKLWHIFAQDGESEQVLPRGEWSVTGGCDAGMRCATVARFLGFTEMHIFGMDASEGETGKHADAHPNQPKEYYESEYNGKTFRTTPAWISCAQQWFRELDQLGDVNATFYGEGLIQEMAKDYVKKPVKGNLIAFNRETLISDEMKELNARLHKDNIYYGVGGGKYAELTVSLVAQLTKAGEMPPSVLDYGCGKGFLAKELPFPIYEYDPAIPGKDELPRPADIVLCTDVLEHIEKEKIEIVLDDLRRVVKQVGYFVIHLGAAQKTYANGQNAHILQKSPDWWYDKLLKYFTIGKMIQKGNELHAVVAPKDSEKYTTVGNAKFYTPNEVTKWRANSILTKEPITIEWLNAMQPGEVLYDIGANVGGYTVLAGLRGVNVYSFEPEAENFSILSRNLAINKLPANAYPMAVSDRSGFDVLHLSQFGAGGSCHTFRDAVGFDGNPRDTKFKQGCIGITLDAIKGQLPQPDHIKIDVDGLEPKVIKGAIDTLKGVRSLLIEINPSIPAHLEMIDILKVLGFTYDKKQVEKSTRKDGPFKGVAEYVFTRDNSIEKHVIEVIKNAEVINDPFPHMILENVFPDEYFKSILSDDIVYKPIREVRRTNYPERFVGMKEFPEIRTTGIRNALLKKFGVEADCYDETLLIKDIPGYQISPHTDLEQRVLSVIFYLNGKDGTSLYVPKEDGFTSDGKKHLPFEDFKRVKTVPNKPNTAFVFLRTPNSFHGVAKTKAERNVLLYDIRRHALRGLH